MAEKEYIDREALMKDINETVIFTVRGDAKRPNAEMRGANKVKDRIMSAPAADVVEVVRCKDCVYSDSRECPITGEPLRVCNYGALRRWVADDQYCKDGRKG